MDSISAKDITHVIEMKFHKTLQFLISILLMSISLVCIISFIMFYKRSVYRIGKGKYITVWTTYDARAFIIPGRYYWPFYPNRTHIETSVESDALGLVWNAPGDTIYYSDNFNGHHIHNSGSANSPYIKSWETDKRRLDSMYLDNGSYKDEVHYLTLSLDFGYASHR